MQIDIESLERAAQDAVAPATVESHADWLLPFDRTTIGRAISPVPLKHDLVDSASIAAIEAIYLQRAYRVQFRVADAAGLQGVHRALRERGYAPQQPTLTMTGNVRGWSPARADWTVQLTQQASQVWKSAYLSAGFDPVDGANRIQALSRSTCLVYAHISDASGAVAAGTASLSQGWEVCMD